VHARIQNVNCAVSLLALLISATGCESRSNAVSGTIEVDEVHVGPRSAGRVEKIFAQEGDRLHAGQPIVQLDAAELKARRDLAVATPSRRKRSWNFFAKMPAVSRTY
jgi:multidrug efflux pump subunit AcrA (membrane-fusion protein)